GEALADGREDFEASGREWRTPPLWGLGLVEKVNEHNFFLHDGRARGFQEAILWHGGEAEQAKENYKNLPKTEREKILLFLKSL
ncbi:MAG: thiol oxidoreductase, partial [Leptospiraceae bacterium]|nr:thiol oxidoreductase [Leptospiraceae bacterium]